MSNQPSSTAATDGSNQSLPLHIGSISQTDDFTSSTTTTISDPFTSGIEPPAKATEEAARMTLFLNDNVEANPTYQHSSSSTSVAVHSAQMRTFLDSFDEVMKDGK